MTITLDGTKGTTSPGLYSNSTFTGTYGDGIVLDYTPTLGRISTGTADALAFYNGGVATTELMRLDSSGNLGIGTSSPSYKLQITAPVVNSGISVAQLITNAGTGQAGSAIGLGYGTGNGYYAQLSGVYDNTGSSFTVSTSALGVAAAERMRIDSSGNLKFDSGYGSVATAYGCRAWVNFNGTGTVAIRASGNVSSITDNGTGQYVVNLTNALPDINYTVVGSCSVVGSYPLFCNVHSTSAWSTQTPTTTAFAINSPNYNASGFGDPLYFSVAVFR